MHEVLASLRRRFQGHDWAPVTSGHSGASVWRLRGATDLFVKVSSSGQGRDDLPAEAERLAWLDKAGLPVPEIVETGTQDGTSWLVTVAVPGRPASATWEPQQRAGVVDAVADVASALHALPVAGCPFDHSLAVTMAQARQAAATDSVDLDAVDADHQGWTVIELLGQLEATRPGFEDLAVCHGDLCLPNVLLDLDTMAVTALIDVGSLGVADRYVDLALVTRSLSAEDLNPQFGQSYADRFFARYGDREPDPQRLYFYRLLDEFF